MMSLLSLVVLGAFLSPRFLSARAQNTNATCPSTFAWAENSLSQSPCVVASYLEQQCFDVLYTLPAINASQYYAPPTGEFANACECNMVTYSLVSACAACQTAYFVDWQGWISNCSAPSTGLQYPVPSGTEIPAWAYIPIGGSGTWNESEAIANATTPQGSTSSPSSSGSPSSTSTPGTSSGGSSSTNKGAIAGGVVGGVVGVAAIIGIALWVRRRYHLQRNGHIREIRPSEMSHHAASSYAFGGTATTQTISEPLKLYNPDDPSTYPASSTAGPGSVFSNTVSNPFSSARPTSRGSIDQQSSANMQYTGVPEV